MAVKRDLIATTPGAVTFSIIPYYDPDYQAPEFKGFPSFD
jgi:hypothetical protein